MISWSFLKNYWISLVKLIKIEPGAELKPLYREIIFINNDIIFITKFNHSYLENTSFLLKFRVGWLRFVVHFLLRNWEFSPWIFSIKIDQNSRLVSVEFFEFFFILDPRFIVHLIHVNAAGLDPREFNAVFELSFVIESLAFRFWLSFYLKIGKVDRISKVKNENGFKTKWNPITVLFYAKFLLRQAKLTNKLFSGWNLFSFSKLSELLMESLLFHFSGLSVILRYGMSGHGLSLSPNLISLLL